MDLLHTSNLFLFLDTKLMMTLSFWHRSRSVKDRKQWHTFTTKKCSVIIWSVSSERKVEVPIRYTNTDRLFKCAEVSEVWNDFYEYSNINTFSKILSVTFWISTKATQFISPRKPYHHWPFNCSGVWKTVNMEEKNSKSFSETFWVF